IGKGFLQRLSSNDREPDTNAKRQNQSRHHIHDRGHSNREKGLDGTFLDTLNRRRINCTGYDFREDRLTRKKGKKPREEGRQVCDGSSDQQKLPCTLSQLANGGSNQPEYDQRY